MEGWTCLWWCARLAFGWGTVISNNFKWDRDLDLFLVVCWTYFGIHPCTLEGYGLNVSISQEDMNME